MRKLPWASVRPVVPVIGRANGLLGSVTSSIVIVTVLPSRVMVTSGLLRQG